MIPKYSKFVQRIIRGYPTSDNVSGLKGQRLELGLTAIQRGFELYDSDGIMRSLEALPRLVSRQSRLSRQYFHCLGLGLEGYWGRLGLGLSLDPHCLGLGLDLGLGLALTDVLVLCFETKTVQDTC